MDGATSGLLLEGWSALARRRFTPNPLALFLGILAVVLLLLGVVTAQLTQGEGDRLQHADSYASIAAAFIGAIGLLLQAWTGLWSRQPRTFDRALEVTNAADGLAEAVWQRSREEERRQKVHDPVPLPVRWHNAADAFIDRWENIRAVPVGVEAEALHLDNTVDEIAETFRSLPSRRLVVLGKAGCGKTVLAHHLIHQLLEERESTDLVPVLFSLNTWDVTTSLRDWLVAQLRRDYDLDARDSTGRTLAQALVDNDRILPVLDGFDEITAELRATAETHRTALSALNDTDLPMVLTSRPDEYRDAVTRDHFLARAAAIEIEDLTLDDLAGYLGRTTRKSPSGDGTAWDPVIRHLRQQPHDPASAQLRQALTTPLMVFLARTIYSAPARRDPAELLDITRFPSTRHIEDRLLDKFIPALYGDSTSHSTKDQQPHWSSEQAGRWLGYLADHLTRLDTHDLAWWQLGITLHRRTRILTTTIIIGLGFGLALASMLEIIYGLLAVLLVASRSESAGRAVDMFPTAFRDGLSASALGLAIGALVGFLNEVRFLRGGKTREPERLRLHVRNIAYAGRFLNIRKLAAEFTTGFAVGFTILLVGNIWGGPAGGTAAVITSGFAFGTPIGLINIVVAVLGDSHSPQESVAPWKLLSTDRTITLIRGIMFGIAFGVMVGVVAGGLLGVLGGVVLGFLFALSRLTLSSWGQWLLFARLWLPLTRRLPWRPKRFLEDAYDRGVLRQAGAVYQFRHAQLRDQITNQYRNQLRTTPPEEETPERDDFHPVPEPP